MSNYLGKINVKIFNASAWIVILMAYLLPFHYVDGFETEIGFPFAFIRIYDAKLNTTPLNSMSVNPLVFLSNIFVVYLVLSFLKKVYLKIKNSKK